MSSFTSKGVVAKAVNGMQKNNHTGILVASTLVRGN